MKSSSFSQTKKRKRKTPVTATDNSADHSPISEADERLWLHYFYYHHFRWMAHVSNVPYINHFPHFLPPADFNSWEEYWMHYANCFVQHCENNNEESSENKEMKLLLSKLAASKEEKQLHEWAKWAVEYIMRNRTIRDETVDAERDVELAKYWAQRHYLFSRFDEGILLHREGWFSVTPEEIAIQVAENCRCDVIIDAFCGAGGNSIQFAFTCNHVIAIDIDPTALRVARHNAAIYGVADRIDFVQGDYLTLIPKLQADVVYLSPPWGGPDYLKQQHFNLRSMPIDGVHILRETRRITQRIAYMLPRNVNLQQLHSLADEDGVEVEHHYLKGKIKAITAYFGNFES